MTFLGYEVKFQALNAWFFDDNFFNGFRVTDLLIHKFPHVKEMSQAAKQSSTNEDKYEYYTSKPYINLLLVT